MLSRLCRSEYVVKEILQVKIFLREILQVRISSDQIRFAGQTKVKIHLGAESGVFIRISPGAESGVLIRISPGAEAGGRRD